ncbi:unnamed protein product [Phyllotreta striolata]|uniref:Uncharacterized protein n=1 Tax=Phyllotreta striolata TaxID=444603 RepID=A0A9P0DWU5_PHYSR|nr:unnamed protein product [Phyllotreta striolata]
MVTRLISSTAKQQRFENIRSSSYAVIKVGLEERICTLKLL